MSVAVGAGRQAAHVPEVARPAGPSALRLLVVVIGETLRRGRRAPLTWGLPLGAMSALMAGIWPSISDSMDTLTENYPSGLKEAFGIQELNSVEKYIDAEMLSLIVPLALAFFAVRCLTNATVAAEEGHRLDTLLSLPLPRWILMAGTWVATGVSVAAVLAVAWALTMVVGIAAGTGISAGTMAAGYANVWPLAMAFAGFAALMSGLLHRAAAVTAWTAGTLVGMYVLDLVGKLADGVEPLRPLSAFRWYGSAVQDGLDVSHVVGLTLAGVVLCSLGAVFFERRDIN